MFSLTQRWGWHNASFPGPRWALAQALHTPETTFPSAHEPLERFVLRVMWGMELAAFLMPLRVFQGV